MRGTGGKVRTAEPIGPHQRGKPGSSGREDVAPERWDAGDRGRSDCDMFEQDQDDEVSRIT